MNPGRSLHQIGLLALACLLATQPLRAGFELGQTPGNPALGGQVAPGSTVTLSILTGYSSGPNPPFQWYFNDQLIPGATNDTLVLSNLTTAQTGNYSLRFLHNGITEDSNPRTLNVSSPPPSPVDLTFTSGLTADHPSFPSIQVLPDGRIVLFGNYGPTNQCVRLLADGRIDASFRFPADVGNVVAVLPNGEVIVSGAPHRLNVDGSAGVLTLPASFPAPWLGNAAVQSDGRIVVAQDNLLARVNADGSPDIAFPAIPLPIFAPYTPTDGHSHWISAIKVDSRDRIYIEWRERNESISHGSTGRVVRLNPDGTPDPTFPELEQEFHSYQEWTVFPLSSGQLFGSFDMYTSGVGTLFRLRDDGSIDPSYPGTRGFGDSSQAITADGAAFYQWFYAPASFAVDSNIIRRITPSSAPNPDPTFYPGESDGRISAVVCQPDGKVLVAGDFTNWDGHVSPGIVRLRADTAVAPYAPVIRYNPSTYEIYLRGGDPFSFDLSVIGIGPLTYQWFGLDGQPPLADPTLPTLAFAKLTAANLGRYQCRVAGPGGSTLSQVIYLQPGWPNQSPGPVQPRLINLSGRAAVGDGEDSVIAGTVAWRTGSRPMRLLVRGVGPALGPFGVSPALPDPVLHFFDQSSTTVLATNSGWGGDPYLRDVFAALGAFPFPADSSDAAMVRTSIAQGSYTVQLSSQAGRGGVGLIELYDFGPDADQALPDIGRNWQETFLVNLSVRARVGPGSKTLIGGFVIWDPANFGRSMKVLIRAVGPTLAGYGIQHSLANPKLTLFDAAGAGVATNDDWGQNPDPAALAATMKAVGAFALPAGSKDAALLLDLPAGIYTAHVAGADGGTGVALLEIYRVP